MPFFVRTTALLVFVGALLAGCATSGPSADAPRSIVLVHPASGESVATTYWRPGGYDPRALAELSSLFRDRHNGQAAPVDPGLIDTLVELRQRLGLAESAPIHLTSGYRSAATNASLARQNSNVAENSYHIRGQAADIRIPGVASERVAEVAAAMRRGGYALYPHTGHVHVDTGPFRTWTPKGPDHRQDGVMEAKANPRARPGPTVAKTEVAAAKPAPGVSDADAQRLRYMLVTMAAEDAAPAKDKRPATLR
ncbi:YcbK family protein [Azospirillum sp. sgz301742]